MQHIIITTGLFLCNYNGIRLSHSDYYPNGKNIKTPADFLIREKIKRPANSASTRTCLSFILYALHHNVQKITHRQPQSSLYQPATAIILTQGGKRGAGTQCGAIPLRAIMRAD